MNIPLTGGAINWPVYHAQRAAGFRECSENWRKTAQSLAPRDPQFAVFAMERANANDLFAEQAEAQARGGF